MKNMFNKSQLNLDKYKSVEFIDTSHLNERKFAK